MTATAVVNTHIVHPAICLVESVTSSVTVVVLLAVPFCPVARCVYIYLCVLCLSVNKLTKDIRLAYIVALLLGTVKQQNFDGVQQNVGK